MSVNNQNYHGFDMEFRGAQINHLSFVDDIIIFASRRKESLQMILLFLLLIIKGFYAI